MAVETSSEYHRINWLFFVVMFCAQFYLAKPLSVKPFFPPCTKTPHQSACMAPSMDILVYDIAVTGLRIGLSEPSLIFMQMAFSWLCFFNCGQSLTILIKQSIQQLHLHGSVILLWILYQGIKRGFVTIIVQLSIEKCPAMLKTTPLFQ